MIHPLRKLIQKTGFDLRRYRPEPDRSILWQKLDIHTVIDIGANTGQFATEIRGVLPTAWIYSFEPLESCFDTLEQSFKEDSKFKAFNYALGTKEEVMEMNRSEYAPSSSILPMSDNHKKLFPHTTEHTLEQIHIKILDEVAKSIQFEKEIMIKVDVQGFEDKVIEGGLDTFGKARVVLIENSFIELYKGQPLFDNIYQKLKSLGFSYRGSTQQKLDKNTGEIISEDSLFIK